MLSGTLLLAALCGWLCAAVTVLADGGANATVSAESCAAVLRRAGASDEFGPHVAHVIHSLTVRDLRQFELAADEANSVPTINYDLLADEAILPFAPDRREPDDAGFHTLGLQLINGVLNHMDNKNYVVKNFNTLARVVHEFHMQELWQVVRGLYEGLKKTPPAADACACARDVVENGVLQHLRNIAIQIREPQLVYGSQLDSFNRPGGRRLARAYSVGYRISYRFGRRRRSVDALAAAATQQPTVLKQERDGLPELDSAAAWAIWKKELLSMDEASHSDGALYLFCALQKYQSTTATHQSHAGHAN